MCDPVTIAVVGLTVSAIGVGTQAYGAYKDAKAYNAANDYNASVMERNAQNAELRAQDSEARGEIEEKQHRQRVAGLKGEQRSVLAASGVVVDEGSALETLQDTTRFGELDALTIQHNTAMEAWGIRNEKANYQSQANLSRFDKKSPNLAATSTLLTGTGSLLTSASGSGLFTGGA